MDDQRRIAIQQNILRLRQELNFRVSSKYDEERLIFDIKREMGAKLHRYTTTPQLDLDYTTTKSEEVLDAKQRIYQLESQIASLRRRIEREEDKLGIETELV